MKELYIIRHAQKENTDNYEYDYDVPLTKRGIEAAKNLGTLLKRKKVLPDLIVSSPAIRARQSAEVIAKEIDYNKGVMYNEVIYQAYLNELVESISYTYDNINSLMIVGHNPSLTALAITFTNFKTELQMATAIKIEFDCDSWTQIDRNNSRFVELYEL
ncbi:SixA phosphatase family protein [Halarcobacter ebronensis]|uniref:Phosphoglycerate mutase n=1 Tax=Halarcobacter ebronensis TaxID=1462615 RepID=A0A4Q1AQ07_9BACT|nr:histidine phosphatase family protein [Halarcobacter ebronensis]QKF82747.1 phosphohistidine phosphatase [Halarcobacter ebronensis]RXK06772.1 phosphoglycerate mutase [Halarcobacter ebronensis]